MQIIESVNEMQAAAVRWRTQGKLIGLVSTSGSLHAGHRQLIEHAKEQADAVVLSAFVNPLEFGSNEDFEHYPRDRNQDMEFCREAGVDCFFYPPNNEVYPPGFSLMVVEDSISKSMCGISRPHYFRGVCTYHSKLFNLVRPDLVVMGQRDAQKTAVIRKLAEELNFPVEIAQCPTVREEDGLAYNARSQYLSRIQRESAVRIYQALLEGKAIADGGIQNVDRMLAEVTHHLTLERRLRVIYVVAVDVETMQPLRQYEQGRTLIATAVWCDEVRLIDNILL
jgi:pantoate--beta-alanine ligase